MIGSPCFSGTHICKSETHLWLQQWPYRYLLWMWDVTVFFTDRTARIHKNLSLAVGLFLRELHLKDCGSPGYGRIRVHKLYNIWSWVSTPNSAILIVALQSFISSWYSFGCALSPVSISLLQCFMLSQNDLIDCSNSWF